jgi:DNA polymerase III delta prime subunit
VSFDSHLWEFWKSAASSAISLFDDQVNQYYFITISSIIIKIIKYWIIDIVRVGSPSIDTIEKILLNISHRETFNLPKSLANKIAVDSERNLRRAILQLQNCKVLFLLR